ncbi:MAG TPA: hypothetical protein VN449_02835 [Gaiellaceae bacterium]|jgi:hypothetical protein|nr:hypothetical protein [Gaiellaceae bacterium]HXU03596.1 hypothetical protein [Polyangia bacterium]
MEKKIALFGVLAALATAAVLMVVPATVGAWPGNGAGWQGDNATGCSVFDQNGNLFSAGVVGKFVVASDGSATLVCKATTANDADQAITYSGFECGTLTGITTDTTETISKKGNLTLVCHVPAPPA